MTAATAAFIIAKDNCSVLLFYQISKQSAFTFLPKRSITQFRSSVHIFVACAFTNSHRLPSRRHKVMHAGFRWAHGSNMQRLMVQMQLEYGRTGWCDKRRAGSSSSSSSVVVQEVADAMLRLLLRSTLLATVMNSATLLLELSVLPTVLLDAAGVSGARTIKLSIMGALVTFHVSCLVLMKINFLWFWLPTIVGPLAAEICAAENAIRGVSSSSSGGGAAAAYISAVLVGAFALASARGLYGGAGYWPISNFQLYSETLGHHKSLTYYVLQFVRESGAVLPFDLDVCSSS